MEADSLDIRLLRFRSRRDEPALGLARALLDAGRPSEAIEVVHAGLAVAEDDPLLLLLEGRAWFEQGDLAQAQAALLRAAKGSPRDKEPYRWLAQVLMKRGEPSRAVQVLERAMSLDPTDRTLVQAHARAQRLARIALDVESGSIEVPNQPEALGASTSATVAEIAPEPPPALDKPSLRIPPPPAPRIAPPPARVEKSVPPEPPAAVSRPAPPLPPPMVSERPAAKTKEPIALEPSAAKTKEPIAAEPSAAKTKEPIALEPSTAKTKEPIALEPSAAKTKEPTALEPSAAKTKEPIALEPSAAKTKEPIALEPSAAKTKEPIAIEPSAAKTKEPIAVEPSAAKTKEPLLGPAAHDMPRAAAPTAPIVPLETERDTAPPPPDMNLDHEVEDEPTRAYELPPEIASMLENERSSAGRGAAHIPSQNPLVSALDASPDDDDDDLDSFESEGSPIDSDDDEPEPTVIGESLSLIPDARQARREDAREVVIEPAPAAKREAEREAPAIDESATTDVVFAPSEEGDSAPAEQPFTFEQGKPEEPESPEQVLDVLATQGVFENKAAQTSLEDWVAKKEAPRGGERLGRSLAVGWVLALAAAGGGYYGFTRYLDMRRADASTLIEKAVAEAREGEHGTLMAAERHLAEARELDPKSAPAVEALLFVHTTRALEAGGDVGYLRATIARAEQAKVSKPLIAVARAVVAAYDRDADARTKQLDQALAQGGEDARVLYLSGRLLQRTGSPDAEALLTKASEKDAGLALAFLARAEIARQSARIDEARELFAKALGKDGHQLRAELWTVLLDVSPENAPDLLRKLDGLKAEIEKASSTERVLALVARAAVLGASGDVEASRAAVREAATLSNEDPEILSLLADRAARVGEHDLAYRAANSAVARAPGNRRYRDALANVLLKRGDGQAVLAALSGLEDQSTWMLTMRARAALLSGTREALEDAKRTLSAHRASEKGHEDYDAASLLLRVDLRLGANAESLLAAAKGVAEKAPESPLAMLALGETYVLAGRGEQAVTALEKARALGSDDADIYALLGRAYRLQGDPTKAMTAFKQGLDIAPSHAEARQGYGSLLLDLGKYAEAESLFSSLEKERATTSSTLGIIEALVGRGEVAAAKERLAAISEEKRALPAVIAMTARVAIADKRASEAAKLIEPLVVEESELRTAEMLVLFGDALYADSAVDSAAGAYEAALELDPEHPNALIGRAMCAVRAEKLEQAFELLDRAEQSLKTRVRPDVVRATLALTRAKGLLLKQDFTRAKDLLAPVVAVPGVPAETFFWYAETLAKTKTAGAAEQYTKYLELEPEGEFAARAKKALAPR